MAESNNQSITIYTIGHSNVRASKIIELLGCYSIQVLIDVRSTPYSQYNPQFDREVFEYTLQNAKIEYKYAGDLLGGRPKDPTCYKDGHIPEGHADYLHLVDYQMVMTKEFFINGIQLLLTTAVQKNVAIMCSEEDPQACHRHHLIGKYLTQQGITVLHIRGDGNKVNDKQLSDLPKDSPAEQLNLFD